MICHNAKGEMCLADDPDRLVWFGDCGWALNDSQCETATH